MEVIRIYPAGSNNGKATRTRKNLKASRVDTFEEWPSDADLTLVMANNESFVIDESYASFEDRLKTEKAIDL